MSRPRVELSVHETSHTPLSINSHETHDPLRTVPSRAQAPTLTLHAPTRPHEQVVPHRPLSRLGSFHAGAGARARRGRRRDGLLRRRPRRPWGARRGGQGLRPRAPRLRDPERDRHPLRHRERDEGPDRARGREPRGGRHSRALDHRALAARRGPPARRRRRDRRAPALASLRHRGLPRRGCPGRRRGVHHARAGARARDDRAVPRGPGRVRAEVRGRTRTSRTATAATSSWRCSPSARAASRTTSSSACASASPRAWPTRSSSARTSCPRARHSATSRVDGARTNVFHLPVRGVGDGGIYTTVADVRSLWIASLRGEDRVGGLGAEMVRPGATRPPSRSATASASGCTRRPTR